ncbi:MAG: hypothetical protein NT120_01305 [Candidatus Aenigmarchaeota archaeon]|nr:hypothetical protein [Candidatus Aenigmarchaeota archaeon]
MYTKSLAELKCEIAESASELRNMLSGHEKGQLGYVLNNVAVPLSDVRTYSMLGATVLNAKLEDLENLEKDEKLFKKGSKERELIASMKDSLHNYLGILTRGDYGDKRVKKYYETIDGKTKTFMFDLTGAYGKAENTTNLLIREYMNRSVKTLLDRFDPEKPHIDPFVQRASMQLAESLIVLDLTTFGENHEIEALKKMKESSARYLKALKETTVEVVEEHSENKNPGDKDTADK